MADGGGSGVGVRTGGGEQFERWFRDHAATIYRYAVRRLGPMAAEDIVAGTFVEAWASLDRYDPSRGSEVAWLLGIATHLIHRQRRSEIRQLRAYARTGTDPFEDAVADLTHRLDAAAAWPAVAEELLTLRAEDRDLFWLQATTDLTYAELAEVTGVAIGTVRSRLARTRERLRVAAGEPALSPSSRSRRGPS